MGVTRNSRRRLVGALAFVQVLVFVAADLSAEEMKVASGDPASRGYESARESAVPFNGSKGFDAVAVRPTTFFTSLVSAGAFVVSLPFAALDPAIGVDRAKENLVDYPFKDTFKRPLGDLDAMGRPPAEVSTP